MLRGGSDRGQGDNSSGTELEISLNSEGEFTCRD
jgi:hypothetical protein